VLHPFEGDVVLVSARDRPWMLVQPCGISYSCMDSSLISLPLLYNNHLYSIQYNEGRYRVWMFLKQNAINFERQLHVIMTYNDLFLSKTVTGDGIVYRRSRC
jgi:hypothetical protein